MQDTAYEEEWNKGEDPATLAKPIESAASKAARAAREKEALEFSEAFHSDEIGTKKVDETAEGDPTPAEDPAKNKQKVTV